MQVCVITLRSVETRRIAGHSVHSEGERKKERVWLLQNKVGSFAPFYDAWVIYFDSVLTDFRAFRCFSALLSTSSSKCAVSHRKALLVDAAADRARY